MQEILFAKSATFRGKGYFAASGRWKDFFTTIHQYSASLFTKNKSKYSRVAFSLFLFCFWEEIFPIQSGIITCSHRYQNYLYLLTYNFTSTAYHCFLLYLSPLLYTCAFYHCFISLPFTIDTYLYLLPLLNTCTFYHCFIPFTIASYLYILPLYLSGPGKSGFMLASFLYSLSITICLSYKHNINSALILYFHLLAQLRFSQQVVCCWIIN